MGRGADVKRLLTLLQHEAEAEAPCCVESFDDDLVSAS